MSMLDTISPAEDTNRPDHMRSGDTTTHVELQAIDSKSLNPKP